jgi:hypothetical protein
VLSTHVFETEQHLPNEAPEHVAPLTSPHCPSVVIGMAPEGDVGVGVGGRLLEVVLLRMVVVVRVLVGVVVGTTVVERVDVEIGVEIGVEAGTELLLPPANRLVCCLVLEVCFDEMKKDFECETGGGCRQCKVRGQCIATANPCI